MINTMNRYNRIPFNMGPEVPFPAPKNPYRPPTHEDYVKKLDRRLIIATIGGRTVIGVMHLEGKEGALNLDRFDTSRINFICEETNSTIPIINVA